VFKQNGIIGCFTLVAIILFSNIAYSTLPGDYRLQYSGLSFQTGIQTTYNLKIILYGNITNLGEKPIPVNETDLLAFPYPLNLSFQKVLDIRAWVDNVSYNYTIVSENNEQVLIIDYSFKDRLLNPGESISAGVEYVVAVDQSSKLTEIKDFLYAKNPVELVSKAGDWSDLEEYVNETTVGITKLWNFTHPLIKLVERYITSSVGVDKPYSYLLGVLRWIDENLVYSTRVPPRYPFEVIIEGAGDCDDQSNLLITLLRAKGIPSFLEIGFVYIGENYRPPDDTSAGGLLKITMIGGGGHGWVVAYIPPWGWIRIDPVVGSGYGVPLEQYAIILALYYTFPTVVYERRFGEDYVSESAREVDVIQRNKIQYHIVLEMHLLQK